MVEKGFCGASSTAWMFQDTELFKFSQEPKTVIAALDRDFLDNFATSTSRI